MCQKVLFGEKDVMELLQKKGQNVNQTISRARSLLKKINHQILLLERPKTFQGKLAFKKAEKSFISENA